MSVQKRKNGRKKSTRKKTNHTHTSNHVPKKTARHFDRRIFIIIGIVLASLILIHSVALTVRKLIETNRLSAAATSLSPEKTTESPVNELHNQQVCVVKFEDPQPIGTSQAIIFAELISEKNGYNIFGFIVYDTEDHIVFESEASVLNGGLYAKATGLLPDTRYRIKPYCIENGNRIIGDSMIEFITPARAVPLSEIEALVESACPESTDTLAPEVKTLYQAHALMALLGLPVEAYGRMDACTQVNQVMLDYSLNAYHDFVFWDNIIGEPTETSVALLKDILSVNPDMKKDDILKDFVVSPYSMTPYALYNRYGGQISSENYILDMLKTDAAADDCYTTQYPYVVDSPEFQDKYADLITGELSENSEAMKDLIRLYGKETFEQDFDTMLAAIAAKNKVLFAKSCESWLMDIAVLPENLICLYDENGSLSDNSLLTPAMVGYAYTFVDIYEKTGLTVGINNTYRTNSTQWTMYSKGYGQTAAMGYSGLWHLDRQRSSCVPGFSNHQLAVSIDFEPNQYAFIDSPAYDYLKQHAVTYGFYNDTRKPWHWTYLGTVIPENIIESTPLETPILEE